jgi:uroporphyrinogen decarboxylase
MVSGKTKDSNLVRAARGDEVNRHPVWFMRQAGRSLPEYRKVREGISMLDACLTPDLASQITLQPVRRHDVDAAVFFSDIVVPLRLAGVPVEIQPGVGPVLDPPVRSAADVAGLPDLEDQALEPIREAIGLTVSELGARPLVGFAGAPFTLASYMIEGGPSRDHLLTKALMHSDPQTWHALLEWTARLSATFLRAQAEAGASILQLFDSWAGTLSPPDYEAYAAPHSTAVLEAVADLGLPRIHFGTKTSDLLVAMRDCGADVMGIDDRTPLSVAIEALGFTTPVQGNIDPAMLFTNWETLSGHVQSILDSGRAAPGHIVNLGHGVPPSTDPDVLTRVVELVHADPIRN